MDKAEADALLDSYLANSPNVKKAAQAVMDDEAAARAARKAQEKRDAEAALVIHEAAGLPPPAKPKPAFEPIEAYTAEELRTMEIKSIPVFVQGLLQAGFSLLAAAPKRGKSWLMLALAIAICMGTPFLGRRTTKAEVLYLDLESSKSRMKKRMSILMPGGWPKGLHIAHRADLLGDNGKLLLQIEDWLDKHPETKVIIIDTVGRVKGGGRRGENAYETDTRLYGELQALALARGIAIIGVHHYKKGVEDGDDWFEKISGSMGLTGVCDTVMALTGKREEQDCILKTSSRDFEGTGDIVLRFDGGTWVVAGTDPQAYAADKAYRESGIVRGILALMETQTEWQGSVPQLLDAVSEAYHGALEVVAANKFGERLEQLKGDLYERDGIMIRRKRDGGRRIVLINRV